LNLQLKVSFGIPDRDCERPLATVADDRLGRAPCKGGAFLWV